MMSRRCSCEAVIYFTTVTLRRYTVGKSLMALFTRGVLPLVTPACV